MKKLISLLLAIVMVFAMATVAFATVGEDHEDPNAGKDDDATDFVDESVVYVTKKYFLTNGDTQAPDADFTLVQVGAGRVLKGEAESAPALGTITPVHFDSEDVTVAGARKDIAIQLPTYEKVGIYEYDLKEVQTDNNLAGVKYYDGPITLKVTVIEQDGRIRVAAVHTEGADEDKSDEFANEYSAGDLTFSKTVTGNMGDKDRYFKVTVTLNAENENLVYNNPYTVEGGSYMVENADGEMVNGNPTTVNVGGVYPFMVKNGDTITIKNLPYGVTFTVVETSYAADGYTTEVAITDTGTVNGKIDSASEKHAITNKNGADVDTGIVLDSLPYVLLLAVAVIGMAVMMRKKRSYEN